VNLYDAHNHLQDAWLTPHRASVFADLASAGIRCAVVNGTCETDWPEVAALCRFDKLKAPSQSRGSQPSTLNLQLLPSYGLHPWDVGNRTPDWQSKLLAHFEVHSSPASDSFSRSPAVGEIGLDRWILDRARPDDRRLAGLRRAPIDEQTDVFLWQLALAADRNLPASIHCLDAFGLLHDLLRAAKRPARGFLLHAYSGPAEMVKPFADLGAHFSFNGGFLAPKNARLRELYATLPADRLLVETDAPAMRLPPTHEKFSLPPADGGSLINHPANLVATYTALAALRRTNVESLAAQVEKNFLRLFTA
jgi:TatD DNase family protein